MACKRGNWVSECWLWYHGGRQRRAKRALRQRREVRRIRRQLRHLSPEKRQAIVDAWLEASLFERKWGEAATKLREAGAGEGAGGCSE